MERENVPEFIRPAPRNLLLARTLAWVLLGLIFWIDSLTPLGIGDPVLYVAPILLFLPAGAWWEPLLVAVGSTVLTVAGVYVSHPQDDHSIVNWNRGLALLAIW